MNARKTDWKKWISTALFIVLAGLLIWYVRRNWDDMKVLLTLSPRQIALLLALALGGVVMNSLYHLMILSTYGLKLSLTDWMGVVCVSNAIAYVVPMRGDLLFTAAYYKRAKGLAYTKSASMAAGNIVFGVAFSMLQIVVSLLCIGLIDGQWPGLLWALCAAGCALLAAFVWFSLRMERGGHVPKRKILADVMLGFNALLKNGPMLRRLLLCLIGSNALRLLEYLVCFRAIGVPVTVYEALFYNSVSWLATIVAIVPGNVGIRESILGVASLLLGAVFSNGVAASLLQRVAVMAAYLAMAAAFAWPVYRNFNRGKGSLTRNEG